MSLRIKMVETTEKEKSKKVQPHYIGHRQRLRERFLKDEGKSMPDYELLELLLTIAIPRKDVKPLAKSLLAKFHDYAGVLGASQNQLAAFGLTQSTIAVLKIVSVSAVKMSWQKLAARDEPIINTYDYLIDYCQMKMGRLDVEEFCLILLDGGLRVVHEMVLQRGTLDGVAIHAREVLKAILDYKAKGVVLVHNHPGGKLKPSQEDIARTKDIENVLKGIGVKVYDHLIIVPGAHYSFKENGLLA